MEHPWPELDWWKSTDWDTVRKRLDNLEKLHGLDRSGLHECVNPARSLLFQNLRSVGVDETRVVICGQDPYPDKRFATGVAFSIPARIRPDEFPRTLRTIFKEYSSDLGFDVPSHGDLRRWTEQGVLLLNAIPSLGKGGSLSHDWKEYHSLTREIVEKLQRKGIVFAFLGAVARRFEEYVTDDVNNRVICTSHPSPRGNLNSKTPFTGSRLFSTINSHLNAIGLQPIDWSLDVQPASSVNPKEVQRSSLGGTGGRILSNINGFVFEGPRTRR